MVIYSNISLLCCFIEFEINELHVSHFEHISEKSPRLNPFDPLMVCAQMQTKRSVWTELDLKVVMMGQPGSVEVQKFPHALISIYLVLAFTPFVTFLIVNVAAEKEHRLKDTMTMMGLYDTAFW